MNGVSVTTKRFVIEISEKNLSLLREMIRERSDKDAGSSTNSIPKLLGQLIEEAISDYADQKHRGRIGIIDI